MVHPVNAGTSGTNRGFSNIEEVDGSPSLYPYKILFPNDALIDNGDGTATLSLDEYEDKHFVQSFNGVSEVEVTHNLGKYVSVTVIDSADTVFIADVDYDAVDPLNKIKVSWNNSTSGKIFCN